MSWSPLLDTVADDPLGDYRTGLERLASVPGIVQVVPGHGHVGDAGEFQRRMLADSAYLDTLALGKPFSDPRLEDGAAWMRTTHEEQLRYYRGSACALPGMSHQGRWGKEFQLVRTDSSATP